MPEEAVPQDIVEVSVTRAQVVEAARQAIMQTEELPIEDAARLMRVAEEKPEFALYDWAVGGRCGCLVGWLDLENPCPKLGLEGKPLYDVGLEFNQLLASNVVEALYVVNAGIDYVAVVSG